VIVTAITAASSATTCDLFMADGVIALRLQAFRRCGRILRR
jgi:hypothetical protein